jgi:hypothetical protein
MQHPDHSLIYQAQKFVTAENVHSVNTWIFCYAMSPQDSPRQARYEQLLREFVATKNLMIGASIQAKVALHRGIEARRASTALDEEIKRSA